MYAVIQTGGKQYKVSQGDVIEVEKLDAQPGAEVAFDVLLVANDADINIGKPFVEGVKANAKVIEHGKGPKVIIFKYKPKKDFRKKQGHRQPFTRVEITSIG
jgi:large subunit ribosomal protein L21